MRSLILVLLFLNVVCAQKVGSQMYFKDFMGHVHKSPSVESSSLTAIQCAFKVKVLISKRAISGWSFVKVGEDIGFIENSRLSYERPTCFQEKYQDYYNALNLDLTELYHLGKLDEQMIHRESKAK